MADTTKLNNDLKVWGKRRAYALPLVLAGITTLTGVAITRDRLFHFALEPDHIAWAPTVATGVGWFFLLTALGVIALAQVKRRSIRRKLGLIDV